MILDENERKWRRNEGGLKVLVMEGLERENGGRDRNLRLKMNYEEDEWAPR